MLRGIYSAASGMMTQKKAMDATANNLTNSQTAGFKRDEVIASTFGDLMIYNSSETSLPLGSVSHGTAAREVFTSQEQGMIEESSSPFDFALCGEGFFTLQSRDGSIAYSRNGRFGLSEDHILTDSTGCAVLGQNGPIRLHSKQFTVTEAGDVYEGDDRVDRLALVSPSDPSLLTKTSEGLYLPQEGFTGLPFEGKVVQGSFERSNVDVTEAMTDLISQSRAYQTCAQMIKTLDGILQKSVNEIGKV